MNILVVGGTGKTGTTLLRQLQNTSHNVYALIRKSSQKGHIDQFGAHAIIGDLTQPIAHATKVIDVVLFVAGSGGKDVEGVDYKGLAKLVDACVLDNVKRFIYIGSINTGKSQHQYIDECERYYQAAGKTIPEGLKKAIYSDGYYQYTKMKQKAEAHIIDSGINYTILRAGLLTEHNPSYKVYVTENTLNNFGEISRDNVASCFIQAINTPATEDKTFTIIDGSTSIEDAFN